MKAAVFAWSIAAMGLVCVVVYHVLDFVNAHHHPPPVVGSIVGITYLLVGALIASRRPRNPIGWIYVGCLAQVLHDYTGDARRRWTRIFPYTRTVFGSAVAFLAGGALAAALLVDYLRSSLILTPADRIPYLGVFGLVLLIGSFLTFCFNLLLHGLVMRTEAIYGGSER